MVLIAQPGLRPNYWVRLPYHALIGRHFQYVRAGIESPIQKIYGADVPDLVVFQKKRKTAEGGLGKSYFFGRSAAAPDTVTKPLPRALAEAAGELRR